MALGSGRGRQRHTDDTVAGRKNHNRVPEEVKGSPAPRGKKHHRYPGQEHERHNDGHPAFGAQENVEAHIRTYQALRPPSTTRQWPVT